MNRFFKDLRTIERMKQGPLGRYLTLHADQLHAQGYARPSVRRKLQLVADLGRWLKRNHVAVPQLTWKHARSFLQFRKRTGLRIQRGDRAALANFLNLLQQRR